MERLKYSALGAFMGTLFVWALAEHGDYFTWWLELPVFAVCFVLIYFKTGTIRRS